MPNFIDAVVSASPDRAGLVALPPEDQEAAVYDALREVLHLFQLEGTDPHITQGAIIASAIDALARDDLLAASDRLQELKEQANRPRYNGMTIPGYTTEQLLNRLRLFSRNPASH